MDKVEGNFLCRLRLSSFLDARIIEVENDATRMQEKGLFIPIDINELYVTKTNMVYANALVYKRNYIGDGNSHHIKPKYSKKHRDYLETLGYDVPYIATMKPTVFCGGCKKYKKEQTKEEDV